MRLGTLFRNEMLKMRKRLSFWVTLGLFSFIMFITFFEQYSNARGDPDRTFALPSAWSEILGEASFIGLIFGCVVLILLTSSEFSWRTARQNVIDGLSKEQWFLGKKMLLPILALVFTGLQLLFGVGTALLGTDLGAVTEPLMSAAQWKAIGGHLVAFMGLGSMAFLVAMSIRSTGPAMAVWFFYITLGEQLLGGMLGQLGEWIRPALRFLPFNTIQSLVENYRQYDPVAFQAAVERAAANDRPPPELPATGEMVLAVLAWTTLFMLLSFFWFRKRDL